MSRQAVDGRRVEQHRFLEQLPDGSGSLQANARVRLRWCDERPLALHEAEHRRDHDWLRLGLPLQRRSNSRHLPGHVLSQVRAVAVADVEAQVLLEPAAAISDADQAAIALGVEDEDPGGRDYEDRKSVV